MSFPSHVGYTVPTVESQVFSISIDMSDGYANYYTVERLYPTSVIQCDLHVCLCVSVDLSSASELSDNDSDDSDSRELSGYSCRHCYTTSEYQQVHMITLTAPYDGAAMCACKVSICSAK